MQKSFSNFAPLAQSFDARDTNFVKCFLKFKIVVGLFIGGWVVQKSQLEVLSSGADRVVVKGSAVLYHLFLKVVVPHFRLGSTGVKVQIFILLLLGLSWWVSE